jgi:hypothetical protein
MKRSLALGLGAAAVLAVAGCSQNGSYRLSWNFQADGATVSSAVGCGRYYVDSILLTGTDNAGDSQQLRALCTPGWVTSSVPDGTWSFLVQMLDAQGALIQSMTPSQSTTALPIASGAPQAQFPLITLVPLPPSSTGTGNNGDGGVDHGDGGVDGGGVDGGGVGGDGGVDHGDGGVDAVDSGHPGDSGGTHD